MRRNFLPYCIRKLESGNWILLNRGYKPLGYSGSEFIVYDKPDYVFKFKRISKSFESIFIAINKQGKETTYYLYDDSCTPYRASKYTQDYFARLEKLMSYEII